MTQSHLNIYQLLMIQNIAPTTILTFLSVDKVGSL